jgi:DNA-binding CsgD family transcriptional regulator
MRDKNGSKIGDMAAMIRVVGNLPVDGADTAARRRRLVAEFCKVLGAHAGGGVAASAVGLSPRMRQTLQLLIEGDSERQIALKLKISPHTVHVYVKQLYKRYDASSRGELLSRFIHGRVDGAADARRRPGAAGELGR